MKLKTRNPNEPEPKPNCDPDYPALLKSVIWSVVNEQMIFVIFMVRLSKNMIFFCKMIHIMINFYGQVNFFSLSFIPRSLNVRADILAKGARSRGFTFSHVNSNAPVWMVLETKTARRIIIIYRDFVVKKKKK